jgi:hypothetical protein
VDTKRFVTGTLVGGLTLYAVGYVIWNMLFADFFAANAGTATGVPREAQLIWAVALGNLAHGALYTLAIGGRGDSPTVGAGLRIGAAVAFLVWAGTDFILYGVMNVSTLTATVVDPLLELVHGGIAGVVIAAVLGKMSR